MRGSPGEGSLTVAQHLRALSVEYDGGRGGRELGIDLGARWGEVRKLFYAGGFMGTLLREGIDPEEFLQEVFAGLAVRNRGKCPWDARKSSFGHYVHIVMRGVLSNYLRKVRRAKEYVTLTATGEAPNVAAPSTHGEDDVRPTWDAALKGAYADATERAQVVELLALVDSGCSRREAAERLGVSGEYVGRVMAYLREYMSERL